MTLNICVLPFSKMVIKCSLPLLRFIVLSILIGIQGKDKFEHEIYKEAVSLLKYQFFVKSPYIIAEV
jgi:hypothetical protein